MATEKSKPVNRGTYVRYIGSADVRRIERSHWKVAGVPGETVAVNWDEENGRRVPSETFTFLDDENWDRLIVADVGLQVED